MQKVFYPSHYCFLAFNSVLWSRYPIYGESIASQVYPLTPSYGSNWGHKLADFLICLISTLKLLFLQTIAFIKLSLHNL